MVEVSCKSGKGGCLYPAGVGLGCNNSWFSFHGIQTRVGDLSPLLTVLTQHRCGLCPYNYLAIVVRAVYKLMNICNHYLLAMVLTGNGYK